MRNDILFGILLTMLEKKKILVKELAFKYEMSTRTIYRYIDVLCEAGIPIYTKTGINGGIYLSDNFILDRTYFNKDEYARVIAALQSFPISDSINNQILIDKFSAMSNLQEKDYVLQSDRIFVNAAGSSGFKGKIGLLQKAVFSNELIHICYHSRSGEITQRDIEPHAFLFEHNVCYIYAYCRLRNTFRLFKISRIASIIEVNETFDRREIDIDRRKNDDEIDKSVLMNFSLQVKEKRKLDVEEWLGIENVTKTEIGYFATGKMPFDRELISTLLSFGDGIKILAPFELVAAIKEALTSASKAY